MGRVLFAMGVAALLLTLRGADAAVIQIKMAQIAYVPAQEPRTSVPGHTNHRRRQATL
jgi:hypothetical protein